MAATQEQIQEAFESAINLGLYTEMDDMTLINSITEMEDEPEEDKRKALDRVCINGKSITSVLGEDDSFSFADYARAIREALSPENNSFVTVMSENNLSQRAVMAIASSLSKDDIDYSDPETWFETEERYNEAQTKEEIMRNKAAASVNHAANYTANYEEAIQKAIIANLSDNDIDLLKSVTGLDELNSDNLQSALDSIYINGKNLTDKLGEENGYNIADYAREVREALSPENNSFITIMKRNSAFSNPRAVVIDTPENSTPEIREAMENKAMASISYVASYREDMQRAVREKEAEIEEKKNKDLRLFFSSLLPEGEDGNSLDKGQFLEKTVMHNFTNILPDFVNHRNPMDFVYMFMLTREFPEGSGKKPSYEDFFNDDSEEMNEFKVKMGKEFCRIFGKPKTDAAKQFNEETYPTLIKMADAVLHTKVGYHDISEKDDIGNAVFAAKHTVVMHNLAQQFEKCDIAFMARMQFILNLSTINESQLNYIGSDSYLNDGRLPDGKLSAECKAAVANEAFFDNVDRNDIKTIENSMAGTSDMRDNVVLVNTLTEKVSVLSARVGVDPNAASDYLNGQDGMIRQNFKDGKVREAVRNAAISAKRNRAKENDDLILDSISSGTGRSRPADYMLNADNLRQYFFGNSKYIGNIASEEPYDGTKRSLLNDLTGCPTIVSREPNTEDKKRLMAAVNTIYINNKSMAEYFGLNENNIAARIEDVQRQLAGKILNSMENNGPEFVFVKNGRDSFQEVNVHVYNEVDLAKASGPEDSYGPEDYVNYRKTVSADYKYSREMATARNNTFEENAKTARAYADILSGRADSQTIESFKDVFEKNNMVLPSAEMRLDMAMEMMSQEKTGNILSGFSRKMLSTPQEFEEAARNIYIGNKTLAELCPKGENMSDEECTRQREQLLKDNFNAYMEDNGKEPKPMSVRDKNGVLKPITMSLGEPPVEPKKVELYTERQTHFHLKSTVDKNIKAYEKYINDNEDYKHEKAIYEKRVRYNSALEETRVKIITEERSGLGQREVNVNQLQMSRDGLTAQNNSPALTQPTAQRDAVQNERTV